MAPQPAKHKATIEPMIANPLIGFLGKNLNKK